MTEFWESAFIENRMMWGREPSASAIYASDYLAGRKAKSILIPGVGYGRNVNVFLERGMTVAGIEISETAIEMARNQLGLSIPIFHGSVEDMPFDSRSYDGIFCFGLLYLLDAEGRQNFLANCYRQLTPGGHMIFSVISKLAPMYGQGKQLGEDWFERLPNLPMYFYDSQSVEREFGSHGLIAFHEIDEPTDAGRPLRFIIAICRKPGGEKATPEQPRN